MVGNIGFLGTSILIVVGVAVAACWALALVDLLRRNDLSGWKTALWLVLLILLPILGVVIYFLASPAREVGADKPSDFYRKFRPRGYR